MAGGKSLLYNSMIDSYMTLVKNQQTLPRVLVERGVQKQAEPSEWDVDAVESTIEGLESRKKPDGSIDIFVKSKQDMTINGQHKTILIVDIVGDECNDPINDVIIDYSMISTSHKKIDTPINLKRGGCNEPDTSSTQVPVIRLSSRRRRLEE